MKEEFKDITNQWFHFYVEKYDKDSSTLLIDFMDDEEYLFFRKLAQRIFNKYKRFDNLNKTYSLLVISEFSANNIHEGGMLIVRRNIVAEWCGRIDKYSREYKQEDITGNISSIEPTNNYLFLINNNINIELELQNSNIISKQYPYKRFLENSLELEKYEHNFPLLVQIAEKFDLVPQKLIVWNVGQGNTNEIVLNNGSLLFDCGCDWHYNCTEIETILSEKNIKDTVLIISHWDLDHYKMLDTPNLTLLNKVEFAIFPSIMYSLTSKRIASRLIGQLGDRCWVISPAKCDNSDRLKLETPLYSPSGENYIDLFVGKNVSSTNISGISLTVSTQSQVLMLTGDHDSSQVWNEQINYVRANTTLKDFNIVVPHHGGGKAPQIVPSFFSLNCKNAIISVGIDNKYGHPFKSVTEFYKKHFGCLLMTSSFYSDIEITLN